MFPFRAGVVALCVGLGIACARADRASTAAALLDDFGDTVAIAGPPQRIVSLSPATTEILFALGAGARLVGRTHWDTYPAEAVAVPDLGNGIRPNVESVLATRPDLVVLYATQENRAAARVFRVAGVGVVSLRLDSIAQFARATRLLGAVTGAEERAGVIVDSVMQTLDRVRAATRTLERPTVFLPAYPQPLLAIGGGSFLSELVEIAGGRNVFGDLEGPSPEISFEEVLRRNPDVVMSSPSAAATLLREPRWRALPAVRDSRVLLLDTALTMRPGVRLGEAAVSIARLLHPGAVR